MKKYMVFCYMCSQPEEKQSSDGEQAGEDGMKPWFDWKAKYEENVIDMGAPFMKGLKLNVDGSSVLSQRGAAGYMIVAGSSEEEALNIVKDSPLDIESGSMEIELYEMMAMG